MVFCLFSTCCVSSYLPTHTPAPHDPHLQTLTLSVYIDRDFSAEERFAIEGAFTDWNNTLNGYLVFQVMNDSIEVNDSVIEQVREEELSVLVIQYNNTDPSNNIIAQTDGIPGNFITVYRNRWSHTDRKMLIEHEIGHILSIKHNKHHHSLMSENGYVDQTKCIDQWTINELVKNKPWMKPEFLNYCKV